MDMQKKDTPMMTAANHGRSAHVSAQRRNECLILCGWLVGSSPMLRARLAKGVGIQGGLPPHDRGEERGSGFGICSWESERDGLGLRVGG
jgi:hypothetical protein